MEVCIIGGGHIGTTLACYIKHHDPRKRVCLYTKKPQLYSKEIKCNDIENQNSYMVQLDDISSNPQVVGDATIIFIALPHFMIEKTFAEIASHVSKEAFIGVLPGCGGCEFFFGKYFDDDKTLFGFQRVPFIARLVEYGKETNLLSWKPYSVVGTQRHDRLEDACHLIEDCGMVTRKASNYIEIALTPSNPILHTARIFNLFGTYDKTHDFKMIPQFYEGWSDEASKDMLAMDEELHTLLRAMDCLDTSAIRPLGEHYESPTPEQMTRKISSIPAFQNMLAPIKKNEKGSFVVDLTSRMFLEDFSFGLVIFRSYFDLFGIKAPTMDKILMWFANYMGYEWYVDGMFCGKDLLNTGAVLRYGISTPKQLYQYYFQ